MAGRKSGGRGSRRGAFKKEIAPTSRKHMRPQAQIPSPSPPAQDIQRTNSIYTSAPEDGPSVADTEVPVSMTTFGGITIDLVDDRSVARPRSQIATKDGDFSHVPVERDPVVEHYGNLEDGLIIPFTTSPDEFETLQVQYMRRLDLARLATGLESATVSHQVGHQTIRFPLRTPPGINYQLVNGAIRRVPQRNYTPVARSEAEWATYLQQHRLPPWFLSPGHLAMITSEGSEEREHLDIELGSQERFSAKIFNHSTFRARDIFANDGVDLYQIQDVAEARNGFLNMAYIPTGGGYWAWATAADRQAAYQHNAGLYTPLDVAALRVARREVGQGVSGLPNVIWFPEERTFNPRTLPAGEGHFEYHTSVDAEHAALNHGGEGGEHNLPDQPSATEIWHLRYDHAVLSELFAEDINVVWIPDRPTAARIAVSEDESDEHERLPYTGPVELDAEEPSGITSDLDPSNGVPGSVHDQTSLRPASAKYISLSKGEISVVVDRSNAQLSQREPHKFRLYGISGWQMFKHWRTFDWERPGDIDRLNRWRRYVFAQWPDLKGMRADNKPLYTEAERQWMAEEARRHPNGYSGGWHELTRRWHQHFPRPQRSDSALYHFHKRQRDLNAAKKSFPLERMNSTDQQSTAYRRRRGASRNSRASGLFVTDDEASPPPRAVNFPRGIIIEQRCTASSAAGSSDDDNGEDQDLAREEVKEGDEE